SVQSRGAFGLGDRQPVDAAVEDETALGDPIGPRSQHRAVEGADRDHDRARVDGEAPQARAGGTDERRGPFAGEFDTGGHGSFRSLWRWGSGCRYSTPNAHAE